MNPYPLGLLLDGRRVLVVGGGTVATRRVPALLDAGADLVIVAPVITPALRALADAGRLTWHERAFEASDVDDVWLVQAALDDPVAAAAVSAAAGARRIFCVRADDRDAATAWTPAVARHGPVTVAVTAGGDPRRSMAVRDRIAAMLAGDADRPGVAAPRGPAARPGLVASPGDAARPGATADPRAATDPGAATGPGAATDPSAATDPGAADPDATAPREDVASESEADYHVPDWRGTVALIGGGPGDPELITVKGRRLLAEADVVVVDRLFPGLLLDELGPHVEVVDASKIPYGPQRGQEEINRLLIAHARAGRAVARLKGGDPYVFGRGGEEVLACVAAGVPVTVVSGVTSAVAAPAAAGIPVTHRGVTHEFVVVSGHLAPDDPGSLVDWAALGKLRGTVCVLMGLRHAAAIAEVLIRHGRPAGTPAAVIQDGATPTQVVATTTLDGLGEAARGMRTPALIVIGEVVGVLRGPS